MIELQYLTSPCYTLLCITCLCVNVIQNSVTTSTNSGILELNSINQILIFGGNFNNELFHHHQCFHTCSALWVLITYYYY